MSARVIFWEGRYPGGNKCPTFAAATAAAQPRRFEPQFSDCFYMPTMRSLAAAVPALYPSGFLIEMFC